MTERRLTILQLNDLHGYLEPHPEAFRGRGKFDYRTCGGLARVATIFKQVRAERPGQVLALDNGDTFHGTFVAGQSSGEAMLPLMNALAFDAMTLHCEFAYGPAQVRKLAAGLGYPALAINIYDQASGQLVGQVQAPLDRATSLEASMDNVLLDAIAAAAGTRLAFSNGWRYGAPIRPDRTYRAAMLGEQGVPKKYGRNRQRVELDAIESLQRWFARGRHVRGGRRGSVVAI